MIGRTRDRSLAALSERYLERARRLAPVEERIVRDCRASEGERRSRAEMAALRAAVEGAEAVVLTERGELWSSAQLAGYLGERLSYAGAPTAFLLGGEEGFRPEDEQWAGRRLALSRMTLPHELARLLLCEQVYRALSMLRNLRYHK